MSDPLDSREADPASEQEGGAGRRRCEDDAPSAEALAAEEDGPFPWDAEPRAEDGPFPWDLDPPPDDPDAPRQPHNAFTEAKKCVYLRALKKTGCVLDACRLTGIHPRTVYRHQEKDPRFHEYCRVALRMCAVPVELTAWQRAVEGVEQEFACGGQVHVRRRYSDGLLRLLLQGSNPKKYGARPGFARKRLLKRERKERERERTERLIRQKRRPPDRSFGEAVQSVLTKIEAIERHEEPEKLAAGWTRSEDGDWIPPGYAWVGLPEGAAAPGEPGPEEGEAAPGGEAPRDSM